jgi:hypothetical protein
MLRDRKEIRQLNMKIDASKMKPGNSEKKERRYLDLNLL